MPRQQIDCPICGTPTQKRFVQDGVELDLLRWAQVLAGRVAGELERLTATYGEGQGPQPASGPPRRRNSGCAFQSAGINSVFHCNELQNT